MNWNAAQTFEPWRTCPVCKKRFQQDEPGCCSAKCEDKLNDDHEATMQAEAGAEAGR